MHQILHVGLGPLGSRIASELHVRRRGRVLAAVDIDPDLSQRPLAELAPGAEQEVLVGSDLGAALATPGLQAAVVTTSSDLELCAPTLRRLLGEGLAVVTTCEEALWPWLRHPELARELDALARAQGGRLLGTGVNPGFIMDTLPALASAVSSRVDSFQSWRIQDATTRRLPFQRKIGAGLDMAAFARRAEEGSLRHVGLGESLHLAAAALGLKIERWDEELHPVEATRELECGLGEIPAGHAAGVCQIASGHCGDREVARLEFVAAIGQADPHDRLRIEGEPPLDLRIEGGVHGDVATAAIVLNSIPALLAAPPGLHTMTSVPAVSHTGSGRPA